MNRLPPSNWNNVPVFEQSSVIFDNKEQNNDRLLDRHFLFAEIEHNTPMVPNNFISSSRKKGISSYNETLNDADKIFNSSLFNSNTTNDKINNRFFEINKGRGAPGWIDFSKEINIVKKSEKESIPEDRLKTHIFETFGAKYNNSGIRPIAQPSNPWAPNTNP